MMDIIEVIKSGDYLILDTETTGLGSDAEICQIAIINSDGNTLLDTLVKPVKPIPSDATAIHGITNEMVKDAEPFPINKIIRTIAGKNVIIYNRAYDVTMLYRSETALNNTLISQSSINTFWRNTAEFYCAMEAFAEIYGDWNDYRQSYRWQKLDTAARYYKVKSIEAHSALGDCLTTLAVCKAMAASEAIK